MNCVSLLNVAADGLDELLDTVTDALLAKGWVRESFRHAVKERERLFPTGIDTALLGVAIPHVDMEHVLENGVCVVTLAHAVTFGMMGGTEADSVEVECLLMLLITDKAKHLEMLKKFMGILRNQADLSRLRSACSEQDVKRVLDAYI